MKTIKVRKIGNSIGIILPKESHLKAGDLLRYEQQDQRIILDTHEAAKAHDRKLIESSFADFEQDSFLTEAKISERFGKYGWQK